MASNRALIAHRENGHQRDKPWVDSSLCYARLVIPHHHLPGPRWPTWQTWNTASAFCNRGICYLYIVTGQWNAPPISELQQAPASFCKHMLPPTTTCRYLQVSASTCKHPCELTTGRICLLYPNRPYLQIDVSSHHTGSLVVFTMLYS